MSDPPLLSAADLSVSIGAQIVLQGVSLTVRRRGIVCVLGSNGVGKTTLMRTISGIYHRASGRLLLDGRDILNLPPHDIVRRGIAQAPEGRHVFPNMTVGENLRVGAVARPASKTAADLERVLALFPLLGERFRQKAGSLSGGEQQMLCIGRAMMARPLLLLLDEPSLGLAPRMVRTIFELIARIREEGTSVLLVEQNARAALQVADHAYVMEGGRTVLDGPAKDIAREERVMAAYLGGATAPARGGQTI
jgi:branched-chain amino acid transport system ATP-binding protein